MHTDGSYHTGVGLKSLEKPIKTGFSHQCLPLGVDRGLPTRMASTQSRKRRLVVREFSLPLGQTLLVFGENCGRNFRREIGVRQLGRHLGNLRLVLLHLFCEPDLFRGNINQTCQRQE